MKYDWLIAGAGVFGCVCANELKKSGCKVLILEKRGFIGGQAYTEARDGIMVHVFGPHLFHTKDKEVWEYVNKFATFNNYQHRAKAIHNGKIYSLPFNMWTYNQLWGCVSPEEAKSIINKQIIHNDNPKNLEEWALSQVGPDIYYTLIYDYTKKQWGREPKELPAFIIKRLPMRFTYNDNYFDDLYQGVPEKGYTNLFENMIDGVDVKLNSDFCHRDYKKIANRTIYTGPIDSFFNYEFGALEYLGLRFSHQKLESDYYGTGQMNHCDCSVSFTRSVEHKHFNFTGATNNVLTLEYPDKWDRNKDPYYPVNTEKNNVLYEKYRDKFLALSPDVVGGGRLCEYKYLNMDQVVRSALNLCEGLT